jgi:PAS domain S-box-containing protein
MENAEAIHVRPNALTTTGPATVCGFSGCIMPIMASSGQGYERLNAQLLVDSIPALIHTARPDGYLDYFNKPWLEYLGVALDKVTGWNWTAFVHPEDLEGIVAKWRACLATGEVFEYETRVRSAKGEYRWMFHRKVPLRDANGNIVKWYGSSLDIEERKRAEEGLRVAMSERTRLAAVRGEVGMALARKDDLRGILHVCAEAMVRHLDAAFARIWTFNSEARELELQASAGRYTRLDGRYSRIPLGEIKIGLIAQERKPHLTNDVQNDPRISDKDWARAEKMAAFAGYPLIVEDRIVGVMAMFSAKPLTENTLETLSFIADGIAQGIERKRAEEELRRSEFYLAEGQRLAHMGSWAFNPDGFYYWSPELFQMYGLNPASKPPSVQEYLDRVHPDDRESMADLIKEILAQASTFDATKRIVRPNGEVRCIRCVGAPVFENQTLQKYVGSAIDVTEHELLTQELRRREAYLAEAQRLSHTGSFGWKPATGEIVWSDETYRIFEYDHSVKPTIDLLVQRVHPEDRPGFLKVIESASAGATQFEHTYRWLLPDGSVKHVHALAHALQDASGNREFVGAATDVTSIKRAEEELRKSEAYLAEAQRLSHTGSWAWSPDTDVRHWSEECYRILGFDPRDGSPRMEEFIQRIHPDDQPAFRESAKRARYNNLDEEVDYRIVLPGGAVRDIHSIGHPVFSPCGDLIEYTGTVIDVTERKRAEEELRRSEMELRQMLDFTPLFVAVFGPNRERLYVNRIALDYLGTTLDEWRQKSTGAEIHPEDSERLKAHLDRASSSGSGFELELRLRKGDGSYRWFLARYNPLHDNKGQVMRWYAACTDIEDRKQAEDTLHRENVALREEIVQASMFEEIVGTSPALKSVLSRISKVAPSDSTVLITGETGTGKELVARAIHRRSDRASRAFVSVNCAAIPRDLIASELFGHEKGAFTGATQQRLGRFELANGGTLFLDEVGELPAETQIALLRVLQEHEFERVGGTRPIRADVRVIAATNRDLQAAISAGSFRSDLFYRLHVFPIDIPPLRERKEDIPLLVEYFIDRYARKAGKQITTVEKRTLQVLQSYPWPGNIRELQNIIERSVIVCETDNFSVDESWFSQQPLEKTAGIRLDLSETVAAQEKEIIEAALQECRGQVFGPSGAAAKLGIPRSTLESKIRSLKINKNRFRVSPGT